MPYTQDRAYSNTLFQSVMDRSQTRVIRENMNRYKSTNPDRYAQDIRFARDYGVAPEMFGRNREQLEPLHQADVMLAKLRSTGAYNTANYYMSRRGVAVSRDDVDNFIAQEGLMSRFGSAVAGTGKSVAKSLGRLFPTVTESALNGGALLFGSLENASQMIERYTGLEAGGGFGESRDLLHSQANIVRQYALESDLLSLPEELRGRLIDNPEYLLDPEWVTFNTGEAINSLIPMIAAAYFSGGSTAAAGAVGGLQEAGAFYNQLTQDPAVGEDNALSASLAFGAATSWLNRIGIDQILGKNTTRNVAQRIGNSFASGGVEALTEYAEEPVQALLESLALGEGPTSQQTVDRIVESLSNVDVIPGAFIAGGGINYISNAGQAKRIQEAEVDQEFFEEMTRLAQDNNTVTRDTQTFEQALRDIKAAGGGEIDTIYINAQDLNDALFQEGQDPDPAAEQLLFDLGVQQDMPNAVNTASDVEVPTEKYIAHVSTNPELAGRINPLARFRRDGMSQQEAETARAEWGERLQQQINNAEAIREQNAEIQAEADQVYDDVLRQRRESGRSVQSAESDAQYWRAFAATFATRYGGTPLEAYQRTVSRIEARTQEDATGTIEEEFGQTGPAPRGLFSPRTRVIALFEMADPSTFIHESGHAFFSMMEDAAAMENAPAALQDDIQTIRNFVGNTGERLTTEQHEMLAQSMETYFLQGKAPSVGLRRAFEKLSYWLRQIYNAVAPGDLSPEIQGVMDRMFASDRDIVEARTYYEFQQPFFRLADIENERLRARYEKRLDNAQRDEETARLQKYTRAYLKSIGGRQAITEQVNQQINAMPVYNAINQALELRGFFIGEVEAHMGREDRIALNKKRPGISTLKGEADASTIALANGFSSPAELFRAIIDSERITDLRRRMVNMAVEQARQDVLDGMNAEGTPNATAEVHSEGRLALMAAELQIIQDQNARANQTPRGSIRRIEAQAVRDVARQVLEGRVLSDATGYYKYSRAEATSARRAQESYQRGDLEQAEQFKQQQMFNHALVLEAIAARESSARIVRSFSRALNRNIDEDYRNQLVAQLQRFGFTQQTPTTETIPFAQFMQNVQQKDLQNPMGPVATPKWSSFLYNNSKVPQSGQTYRTTFTYGELVELGEAVDWMVGTGSNILRGTLATYNQTRDELVAQMVEPINTLKKKDVRPENTLLRRWSDRTDQFIADHQMLPFLLDSFDAYTNIGSRGFAGPNRQIIGQGLADAQSNKDRMFDEATQALQPHLDQFRQSMRRHPKEIQTNVAVPQVMAEDGRSWTFDRVLAIALNMGNETNIQRIQDGYGMTLADIHELTSILTEQDWAAIQGVWNQLNTYFPQINQVHKRLNHYSIRRVEAQPINVRTADGTVIQLEGGYYPLKYDSNLSRKVAEWQEQDDLLNESLFGHPGVAAGMTNQRVSGRVYLPVNLSVDVLFSHLEDSIHYITHAGIISDLDRITQSQAFRDAVVDKFGKATFNLIRPTLRDIARPERIFGTTIDRGFNKLRVLSTAYILGLNTSVAVKQLFSIPGAINDIGLGAYLNGVAKCLRSPIQAYNAMREMSPYMKNRSNRIDQLLRSNIGALDFRDSAYRRTREQVKDFSFSFIRAADFMAVFPIWQGAFHSGLARFDGDPVQAQKFADEKVRQSQPSSQPLDLSRIQRSRGGFTQAFNMFMTFTAKYGNRQRNYWNGWRQGRISNTDFFNFVLFEAVLPPIMMNMMFAAMWGETPEPEDALINTILYQFSGYAFVREVAGGAGYAIRKYALDQDTFRPDATRVPALEGVRLAQNAGNTMFKWLADLDDDTSRDKAVWAFADTVSFFAGIPVPKLARNIAEGMEQYDRGEGTVFNVLVRNPSKIRR